jgi:glycosyltransferase involved in cell wall biosynthesis
VKTVREFDEAPPRYGHPELAAHERRDELGRLAGLRVAYLSDQQYPNEKADAEQVVNTVSALAAEGLDIRLIIPRGWRTLGVPKRRRVEKLRGFYGLAESLRTTELITLPSLPLRPEKQTHGILAPLWARLGGYQLVYTRNPLPAYVATLLGLPVVFETYRIHRSTSPVGRWLGRWSRSRRLLGIITHSSISSDGLVGCGVEPNKIRAIHNGFNPALFEDALSRAEARRRLGLPVDGKIACYAGRMDRRKGIGSLLELAQRTPEITYWLIGKSQQDREGWVARWVAEQGVTNVRRIPWMTEESLVEYLWAADALLIPPTAQPLHRYGKTVLPMKLFKYLAAGRPILAPELPDTEDVLNDRNAVLVAPDELEAAADAVRRIVDDAALSTSLATQARTDARDLTWEARARRIIAFIEERLSA